MTIHKSGSRVTSVTSVLVPQTFCHDEFRHFSFLICLARYGQRFAKPSMCGSTRSQGSHGYPL